MKVILNLLELYEYWEKKTQQMHYILAENPIQSISRVKQLKSSSSCSHF